MTAREFYDRAVELVKDGKYQEATEELGRAIKKDANYAEAYRYRGFLFSLLGFELRAEKDLKQAEALGIGIIPKDFRYQPKPPPRSSSPSPGPVNQTHTYPSAPSTQINLEFSLAEGLNPISAMAASAHQRTLAIGHGDGTISLWNLKTRRLFHTLGGHGSQVTALRFSDDPLS
jgi:tetratricopeptide (TPR) repeat protein